MKEIKEKKRPGVVLIHRDWCSACKTIGRYCREDIPLIRMSKKFVMISAPNGEEPQDETFQMGLLLYLIIIVDGVYFPRLYFINPDGSVNYGIVGDPQAEKYQFYYSTPEQIIDSMKKMIKDLKAKKQRRKARKAAEEAIPENVDENFQVEDL